MDSGWAARLRSLWHGLWRRRDVEAEMAEEFRHHLALRTEDLIGCGMSPTEAARQARIEFGHLEGHREDARAARGLRAFDQIGFSWLDAKLGVRMLRKYPGLSLISVIGMSVAIAVGAGGYGFMHAIIDAPLPLPEGGRIVGLQNSDVRHPGSPNRRALHDFAVWRSELGSVSDLSAFRDDERNLSVEGRSTVAVEVAELSASGFRVAGVAPLLGRPLLDADEQAGAQPVLVIAYDEWQRRFEGDPAIIGRTVRLDTTVHTVVGVMPEGFRFPIDHRYWVPLRMDPWVPVGGGPAVMMFARLADDATLEQARAELVTIGRRMAAAYPETHEQLRPWIGPYTHVMAGLESPERSWSARAVQYLFSLLLIVVSVNVAILVYARTAARTDEIAVRSALGASRRRVVMQLFAEALVLALAAAVIGLTTARIVFEWLQGVITQGGAETIPFWIDLGLSPAMVVYVAGLAILGALIVGVIPALQATRRTVARGIQELGARGSRMQLGRTWTTLIIVQVAVAIAALPYALYSSGRFLRNATAEQGYPIDEVVRATVSLDREAAPTLLDSAAYERAIAARFAGSTAELMRRLEAEATVAKVAYASHYPGSEASAPFEVEGTGGREWVWVNDVDIDLLSALSAPIIAGRGFVESDAAPGANAVIVDRVFAEQALGGGNVLGRRIRQLAQSSNTATEATNTNEWLEIVGVVPAFAVPPVFETYAPKLYRPLALTNAPSRLRLVVRMRPGADPTSFMGRLRELALSVDPAFHFDEVETAVAAERQRRQGLVSLAIGIVAVAGSVLLLSTAGIYAMMSFTVASRRREIGIRAALGAAPQRVLGSIFARAGAQLGAGVLVGLALAEAVARAGGGSLWSGEGVVVLPAVATIIVAIGFVAAFGPARHALAIQPTEALKEN